MKEKKMRARTSVLARRCRRLGGRSITAFAIYRKEPSHQLPSLFTELDDVYGEAAVENQDEHACDELSS